MTQNPYAQFGQPGFGGEVLDPMDRRTSVLAILALIAGLLCFLPGAGILALILGGAAIIFISQSRGRLGGLGLAITGIVLGLLFSIVWVMAAVGAASLSQLASQHFFIPVQTMVTGISSGDHQKARLLLTPAADAKITDAQLDDFAKRIHTEWGAFKGGPANIVDMVRDMSTLGSRMNDAQGRSDLIPTPMHFEKGVTIVFLQVDQGNHPSGGSGTTGTTVSLPVINLGVAAADGTIMWLVPQDDAIKLKTPFGKKDRKKGGKSPAPDTAPPDSEAPAPDAPTPPSPPDKNDP